MMELIIINLIICLALAVLAALLWGQPDERGLTFLMSLGMTLGVSFWGWVFYVAYHFITLYWNGA